MTNKLVASVELLARRLGVPPSVIRSDPPTHNYSGARVMFLQWKREHHRTFPHARILDVTKP